MSRHAAQLYNEPTALLAQCFLRLLYGRGLTYRITWEWDAQSRYRNWTPLVLDADEVVAEGLFSRSTHWWAPTDERIEQLRTGSTKTAAVRALLGRLS